MARIFISYRRADTEKTAVRLRDLLEAEFGPNSVFMDLQELRVGADFDEVIGKVVRSSHVLLALIGTHWLDSDPDRTQAYEDIVLLQIATALRRFVPVIPVLVDEAEMPRETDLPDGVRELATRQAVRIQRRDFDAGADQLVKAVAGVLERGDTATEKGPRKKPTSEKAPTKKARKKKAPAKKGPAEQQTVEQVQTVESGSGPAQAAPTDIGGPSPTVPIDFAMEPHVIESFRLASVLPGTGPIRAGDALRAAVLVSRESHRTGAYGELLNLLKGVSTPSPAPSVPTDVDPKRGLSLGPELAASLTVAAPFFRGSKSKKVWGRDYVTFALLANDPSLDAIASEAGRPLADLRDDWFRFVTRDESHRSAESWRQWWKGAGVALPADPVETSTDDGTGDSPETGETRPRSYISTDAVAMSDPGFKPSEQDSLDVNAQAEIFAALLVAEEVQLPFALGLLGDWGVGKTFFMRLMQESVNNIAGRDVQVRTPGSVKRAAQIEFNAWHYVDSDLWASLASHIFDGLSEELTPGKEEDEVSKTRRLLRRRIDSSQREQAEANAAIAEGQSSREEAIRELSDLQATRESEAAKYDSFRLERVWNAVMGVRSTLEHPDWPDVATLKKDAEETAARLGITNAIESAEDVQRAWTSMREISRRGGGLVRALATDFSGKRAVFASATVLVLLALVVGWPWLMERISGHLKNPPESLTSLLAPFLQLATVVGAIATWAGRNLKSISSAMGYLETIQRELEEPRAELDEVSDEEKELRASIEGLDAEIATQQRKMEEADRQISAAQAEIQRINAGGLVYDFLEGRVRDSRYLDRLGLISVIRQDFEKLKVLLRDWRKHGREDGAIPPDAKPPIERIILYIDDLDRCPPARVVEVLQAVHLILAFDLFVVVVAVDARWLERSLNEAYNPWTQANGHASREPVHRFNAHNYLEKIFQIPFSLPAMDRDGYEKLVVKMLATPREEAKRRQQQEEAQQLAAEAKAEDRQSEPPESGGESVGLPTPAEVNAEELEREAAERAKRAEQEEKRREEQRKLDQEEAQRRVAAMLLSEKEEQFIAALYPFIDTPRLAKRFVNIYRLLRVRAATRETPFSQFIDPETGEYRAALMLMAISVGRPDVAPDLLSALHDAGKGSFRKWLAAQADEYQAERKTLFEPRAVRIKNSGGSHPPSRREARLATLQDGCDRIAGKIDEVIASLAKVEGLSVEDELKVYGSWAREVGRYSFHWSLRADGGP